MITPTTVVSRAEEQVSSTLAGEEVILNLKSGVYYGLDEVGARVWSLMETPRSVAEICDVLTEEYEVERARVEADVLALLKEMDKERLVKTQRDAEAE